MIPTAKKAYDRLLSPEFGWDVIHWVATGVMLAWGLVLFLPGNTMSTSISHVMFLIMATEHTWAFIFTTTGVAGIWAGVSRANEVKVVIAMLLSIMHGMVATLLAISNPLNTGTGTYTIIAVAVTLRLWRLARVVAS